MVSRLATQYRKTHESQPGGTQTGFVQTLEDTRGIVHEEIQKIIRWIEAFSKYARMPEPDLRTIRLGPLIRELVQPHRDYWSNAVLRIESAANDDEIAADPSQIKQILFNLTKNSVEAANGQPVIIQFRAQPGPNGVIALQVQDDGPGLPANVRENLFKPYTTSKSSEKGTGLGLAIGKKIMLEHGGDLALASSPEGCLFELRFPQSRRMNL